MKAIFFIIAIVLVSASLPCQGQNQDIRKMISLIDSISSVKKMDLGIVHFHRISSNGESSSTESFVLSKKQPFKFEGQFLVMGGSYFNLEKLLFFFIREDYIDFYFQGY
ncbi:MAG TPA: hypothetical protein VK179_21225 [Bacteroidales bacterium]|nr:hypothetical protein [Bacteroidales bacterium]